MHVCACKYPRSTTIYKKRNRKREREKKKMKTWEMDGILMLFLVSIGSVDKRIRVQNVRVHRESNVIARQNDRKQPKIERKNKMSVSFLFPSSVFADCCCYTFSFILATYKFEWIDLLSFRRLPKLTFAKKKKKLRDVSNCFVDMIESIDRVRACVYKWAWMRCVCVSIVYSCKIVTVETYMFLLLLLLCIRKSAFTIKQHLADKVHKSVDERNLVGSVAHRYQLL